MSATGVVLAAGLGTRLRPLTDHLPKPLVPVCGVPMLAYALAALARAGHRRVAVNAWHLGDALRAWDGPQPTVHPGLDVVVVVEPGDAPLGTGGGLRHLARHAPGGLASRITVVNADVLCDADLAALGRAVPDGGAALLLRRHAADAGRYGLVSITPDGQIARLRDRVLPGAGATSGDTHFTGLHALDRAVIDRLPDHGPACIVGDAYADLLGDGLLRGVVTSRPWLDVGDPAAYLTANLAVLSTDVPVPLDPFARAAWARGPRGAMGDLPPGVHLNGPAWAGHRAQVGRGTVLAHTVLGAGARVPPDTRLSRCVVWDGVQVPPGDHRDAVFHAGGWLPVHPVSRERAP